MTKSGKHYFPKSEETIWHRYRQRTMTKRFSKSVETVWHRYRRTKIVRQNYSTDKRWSKLVDIDIIGHKKFYKATFLYSITRVISWPSNTWSLKLFKRNARSRKSSNKNTRPQNSSTKIHDCWCTLWRKVWSQKTSIRNTRSKKSSYQIFTATELRSNFCQKYAL